MLSGLFEDIFKAMQPKESITIQCSQAVMAVIAREWDKFGTTLSTVSTPSIDISPYSEIYKYSNKTLYVMDRDAIIKQRDEVNKIPENLKMYPSTPDDCFKGNLTNP